MIRIPIRRSLRLLPFAALALLLAGCGGLIGPQNIGDPLALDGQRLTMVDPLHLDPEEAEAGAAGFSPQTLFLPPDAFSLMMGSGHRNVINPTVEGRIHGDSLDRAMPPLVGTAPEDPLQDASWSPAPVLPDLDRAYRDASDDLTKELDVIIEERRRQLEDAREEARRRELQRQLEESRAEREREQRRREELEERARQYRSALERLQREAREALTRSELPSWYLPLTFDVAADDVPGVFGQNWLAGQARSLQQPLRLTSLRVVLGADADPGEYPHSLAVRGYSYALDVNVANGDSFDNLLRSERRGVLDEPIEFVREGGSYSTSDERALAQLDLASGETTRLLRAVLDGERIVGTLDLTLVIEPGVPAGADLEITIGAGDAVIRF